MIHLAFFGSGVLKNMKLRPTRETMRDQQLQKACFWLEQKNATCFPAFFPNERSLPSWWQVGNRQEDATVLGPVGARSTQTMGAAEKKQEMRSTDKIFLRFSDLGCGF